MRNKLKIAAIVVVAIVGMVLYKDRFDKKERESKAREEAKKNEEKRTVRAEKNRWN